MVDAFADVNRHGVTRLRHVPYILGEAFDERLVRTGDLGNGVRVVVGQMCLVRIPQRIPKRGLARS